MRIQTTCKEFEGIETLRGYVSLLDHRPEWNNEDKTVEKLIEEARKLNGEKKKKPKKINKVLYTELTADGNLLVELEIKGKIWKGFVGREEEQ